MSSASFWIHVDRKGHFFFCLMHFYVTYVTFEHFQVQGCVQRGAWGDISMLCYIPLLIYYILGANIAHCSIHHLFQKPRLWIVLCKRSKYLFLPLYNRKCFIQNKHSTRIMFKLKFSATFCLLHITLKLCPLFSMLYISNKKKLQKLQFLYWPREASNI